MGARNLIADGRARRPRLARMACLRVQNGLDASCGSIRAGGNPSRAEAVVPSSSVAAPPLESDGLTRLRPSTRVGGCDTPARHAVAV